MKCVRCRNPITEGHRIGHPFIHRENVEAAESAFNFMHRIGHSWDQEGGTEHRTRERQCRDSGEPRALVQLTERVMQLLKPAITQLLPPS